MLDIDETLGEFHLQYEFIATMIENFISQEDLEDILIDFKNKENWFVGEKSGASD